MTATTEARAARPAHCDTCAKPGEPIDWQPGDPVPRRSLLWRALWVPCRILASVVFDFKAYGVPNVPRAGGVLLLTNHQSYLDPVLLAMHLGRPVSFLAKDDLFKVPGLSWLIRNLHAFPVKPNGRDAGPLKESIRLLRSGRVLNIFPEGERSFDGALLPVLPGAALVVRKAKVPVVPCVLDRTYRAWPRGRPLFGRSPVRVLYGEPMTLHDLPSKEIVARVESALRGLMVELRGDPGGPNR